MQHEQGSSQGNMRPKAHIRRSPHVHAYVCMLVTTAVLFRYIDETHLPGPSNKKEAFKTQHNTFNGTCYHGT